MRVPQNVVPLRHAWEMSGQCGGPSDSFELLPTVGRLMFCIFGGGLPSKARGDQSAIHYEANLLKGDQGHPGVDSNFLPISFLLLP